jgi:hypothetical protein
MEYLQGMNVVVAGLDANGNAAFLDPGKGHERSRPGEIESVWVWGNEGIPELPGDFGAAPAGMTFPAPGGSLFGIVCFPPHSAGKRKLEADGAGATGMHAGAYRDPSMHRTDTVDYEVIISGRVDIELPNGDFRTLGPGDCLVMAGVGHAWKNRYDEPCIYAAVVLGSRGTIESE